MYIVHKIFDSGLVCAAARCLSAALFHIHADFQFFEMKSWPAGVLAGAAASWKTKFFKWTNVQSFIFEKNLLLIDYIPLVVSRPFIDQSLERFF